jgi:F0F1-type ATP synthase membrane subunit a
MSAGLHSGYTYWWFATIPTALVSYLLGGPTWLTAGALLVAAVVELVAAFVRKDLGDTLSEHVWALIRGRPGLVPLVAGLAVWLVWVSLQLLPASRHLVEAVGWDVGTAALALGVTLSLLVHFVFQGRYG